MQRRFSYSKKISFRMTSPPSDLANAILFSRYDMAEPHKVCQNSEETPSQCLKSRSAAR